MDIDEIIIETLRLAEQMEVASKTPPHIYTCFIREDNISITKFFAGENIFSEAVLTGELCVCAHCPSVAALLLFLLNGIFDYSENRLEWYILILEQCINTDYEDVTADVALNLWAEYYSNSIAEIQEHDIVKPIVVNPVIQNEHRGLVTLTPSVCDIWTVPRLRRQFTD